LALLPERPQLRNYAEKPSRHSPDSAQKNYDMSQMYPTGWGWLTIGFGMGVAAVVVGWRVRYRGRWWAAAIFVLILLVFLFSFMQWASWYK
jgi:hypothetical protein